MTTNDKPYSSRAGEKLAFALKEFKLNVEGLVCADLGCSTGGFTSCLLENGAKKVYAIDTGYGVLDYKLRIDPRVVVMERLNALHVALPEPVDLVTIDVGWTRQSLIIPHALTLLKPNGQIVSLLKPHYELKKAHTSEVEAQNILSEILLTMPNITAHVKSPITGEKAHNTEYLLLIKP